MAIKNRLEDCLQKLLKLGRKQNGYITFESINQILGSNGNEFTINELDYLYDELNKSAIKIVDNLPEELEIKKSYKDNKKARFNEKNKKFYKKAFYRADKNKKDKILCLENAIDNLIYFWLERGFLKAEEVEGILKKCCLSVREFEEVIDFLKSKGIDIPEDLNKFRDIEAYDDYSLGTEDFDDEIYLLIEKIKVCGTLKGYHVG
ncbi:RNA polymerase sigma factor region1.1 domain-containing protein [Carboxydothermus ferrireducens]|uniref:RNA polymerase sigma factor 70 region 1.1 domain-containing protein n=1 Tax=Carboxydothermus ferrireducens DSM 11255 TaxID=1119529 RepID=A0ABX2R8M0_9THEO|nr:RNA polymerase sigma factor region1.1 domain-containing protein [Carboxydothermus ferrireducens]NYE57526.1 hypothetical protein [Carboxydothermus ferrireducens DSM 11255]